MQRLSQLPQPQLDALIAARDLDIDGHGGRLFETLVTRHKGAHFEQP